MSRTYFRTLPVIYVPRYRDCVADCSCVAANLATHHIPFNLFIRPRGLVFSRIYAKTYRALMNQRGIRAN